MHNVQYMEKGRSYTVVHAGRRDAGGRMYALESDVEHAGTFMGEVFLPGEPVYGALFRKDGRECMIERELTGLTCFMEVDA